MERKETKNAGVFHEKCEMKVCEQRGKDKFFMKNQNREKEGAKNDNLMMTKCEKVVKKRDFCMKSFPIALASPIKHGGRLFRGLFPGLPIGLQQGLTTAQVSGEKCASATVPLKSLESRRKGVKCKFEQ